MRRVLVLVCFFSVGAFACVCAGQISSAFEGFSNEVTTSIKLQSDVIENKVTPEIEKSISLIDEENKLLAELIAAESQLSLRRESLIFELDRKIRLMN